MSVNKFLPHLFVLPEDDANRQILNGFLKNPSVVTRRIQVLEEAGGWMKVKDAFVNEHIRQMERFPKRHMLLVVDFDNDPNRDSAVRAVIPVDLADRVFVLGALSEPEDLVASGIGSFESVGESIAKDCASDTHTLWEHRLLRHNRGEVRRLAECVRSFLFE